MKIYKIVYCVTFTFCMEDLETDEEGVFEMSAQYDCPPAKSDLSSSVWIMQEIERIIPQKFRKRFALLDDPDFMKVAVNKERKLIHTEEEHEKNKE